MAGERRCDVEEAVEEVVAEWWTVEAQVGRLIRRWERREEVGEDEEEEVRERVLDLERRRGRFIEEEFEARGPPMQEEEDEEEDAEDDPEWEVGEEEEMEEDDEVDVEG